MKSQPPAHSRKDKTSSPETSSSGPKNDLLIAAIGASAGGIEAFTELVRNLPVDTGIAFVLIQHLDPKHRSILTEILSKETAMSVSEVTDGIQVEANHIYVIPPNATMWIAGQRLQLSPRGESHSVHLPIDHFMRSLAEQQGNRAIGVILSGSGSDGTHGMAEIQAAGGVTFVQDETTAKYDGMPRSAIAAGCVDYVLPPKAIARELGRLAEHPYIVRVPKTESGETLPAETTGLGTIYQLLRRSTGVDFTEYRQTTILRRIQRRMVVHKIDVLEEYSKYLQSNAAEIKALYRDMLINVTSFFRNPKVFEALKSEVFPNIVNNRVHDSVIRIWNPGCASGEETFSIAIALLEFLGDKAAQFPIQFFGTDVNESSITKARSGFYPENIQTDVSPERLRRFFAKAEVGYRISKAIRDMCIFAQQNVLNDPPFSHLDFISCRNLLIYLEPSAQNKVISLFHFATRLGGYLLLGTSEGVGTAANLFAMEDRAFKIFSKKATAARQPVAFPMDRPIGRAGFGTARAPAGPADSSWNYVEAQKEFDRRLLTQFAPATVFVNEDMEIVHTRGNVSRHLKLAPGRASLSLLKMAREGLLLPLRSAISRAKKEGATVKKQNVSIKNGNGGSGDSVYSVKFEVVPLHIGNLKELYFMIVFDEAAPEPAPMSAKQRSARAMRGLKSDTRRAAKLEQELAATREYLQSVIETQEATNEELQSANEEILSSNEELQSTNEELETAKEELQSANEELSTVNDELRNRNVEITHVNIDWTNLFSSIDIAVVIVGNDLTIRRFTPEAEKILGLIPGDVGRPLLNINPSIEIPELQQMAAEVVSSSRAQQKDIHARDGSRFQLRIQPCWTAGKKIDGAVIIIVDVSPAKISKDVPGKKASAASFPPT